MPKISKKKKFINNYIQMCMYDLVLLKTDENGKKKENEIIENLTLMLIAVENCRYGVPHIHHSVPKSLSFLNEVLPNLDEDRFRQIARINWETFQKILGLIRDDSAFEGALTGKQFPVDIQLLIVLYRLGTSGEGATLSKIENFFGDGDGETIPGITDRVFNAILKHTKSLIFWPNAAERKAIVSDTSNELPYCIGFVDGMEIKLAERPSEDHEAYFSRKHIYSLKMQAVCDKNLLLRHVVLGYPGSVHDARIYNNCDLATRPEHFFDGAEWIAGDSAYKLTKTVLTPFRNAAGSITTERAQFNKTFSKGRINIEHCFGLLKERFGSLKELRVHIKNEKSIKYACKWILVCCILHNIAMDEKTQLKETVYDEPEEDNTPYMGLTNLTSSEGANKRQTIMSIIQS